MKTPPHKLALLLATLLLSWDCAGQEFYHAFVSLAADTNAQTSIGARAPHLVDANNTACRLTNTVLTLRSALRSGEMAGIRLGMSTEDVVAAWGKPLFIGGFCLTGPRFSYKDVEVFFEARSNAVERLSLRIPHFPKLQFDDGLSAKSRYLIIGAIIPLFALGLLGCFVTIAGVRRGELRYRGGRWIRGHDGWGFWLVASLCGIGGLGAMVAALWFGLRALWIGS